MQRRLCAAILSLEAVALGLTTPVLVSIAGLDTATALVLGLGLAISCLVVAGLLRFSWAFWLGWALQVAAIALGFLVTTMFVLGAIFLGLYGTAWFLGRKIEVERAQREETSEEAVGGPPHGTPDSPH